jgi:lysozyme
LRKRKQIKNKPQTRNGITAFFLLTLLCFFGYIFFKNQVSGLWFNYNHCSEPRDRSWKNFDTQVPPGFTVHGIDVSHYSCEIDWREVRKMGDQNVGIDFAFIRATRGIDFTDYRFEQNWSEMRDAGIIRGAYHFFTFGDDAEQQALYFSENVKIIAGDLPPVLDIEDDLTGNERRFTSQQIVQKISVWLTSVEKAVGTTPIIYTNADYYKKYIDGNFAGNPIWLASYSPDKAVKNYNDLRWFFWQYSNQGRCNGISEKIDLNVFCSDSVGLKSILKK